MWNLKKENSPNFTLGFNAQLMGGVKRCLNVVTFMFYFKPNFIKLFYVMDDGNSCKVINLEGKDITTIF